LRAVSANRWIALGPSFTKHFGVGFVLTLRLFGRRLLMPREKIATAAALSQAPNAR
jgi:hypothetical protein